jgi:hypothetical protein
LDLRFGLASQDSSVDDQNCPPAAGDAIRASVALGFANATDASEHETEYFVGLGFRVIDPPEFR